ncbi:fused CCA tRNA nucleotidyltransferase/phosphohydrolase [Gammaproteobacteria bacterium]
MKIYLVGGAVRDRLLGRPVRERDFVVVGATRERLLALGYQPVGKDFPVFLHPETHEEYALARTERKTARGYHGFEIDANPAVTLAEDLGRRDLTINAMAEDAEGQVIDPYGGLADLERRLLRHISPAFAEDPVRILRVARLGTRYAPLGFRVAPETLVLMQWMVAEGEVDALVPERVWQEMVRALGEDRPSNFFRILRTSGALARLLPELDRLWGVPQPAQWHPEIDTGEHVMRAVDQAAALSGDPMVRFAALLHDLGKGLTPPDQWPSHHGHEDSGAELVAMVCQRLRAPRGFSELASQVARHHGKVHRLDELRPGTLLDLFEALDLFRRPQRAKPFIEACEADYRGRLSFEARPYPQGEVFLSALAAARQAPLPNLEGLPPHAIKAQIRQARIAALRAVRGERMRHITEEQTANGHTPVRP